jgi:rifampicin phosphotransferase
MGPRQGQAPASTLTGGLDGDTTFEQDALLYRIAEGGSTLQEFLEQFGHRCTGEMELSQPRWRENPGYLEQVISRCRNGKAHNPIQVHHDNQEKRHAAETSLPRVLAEFGGSVFREQIEQELADARLLLPYRESGKHYLMMGYELIRLGIEELSRRWDLGKGIYFLQLDELAAFPRHKDRLLAAIAQRRTRWQALQRLDMPDVIDSREMDSLGLPRKIEATSHLQGSAIAAGVATGTVRIVLDPQDAGDLGDDYILVCPSTDPGWTPLFLNARGLIVERGGVLSHGAIVARDFGIPAVVCPQATRQLHDGDRIRIDGNAGRVDVLDREVAHA